MKPWLKWLIGILIVTLVIGGIATGAYWMHTHVLADNAVFSARGFEHGFGPGEMPRGGMMSPRFERGFGEMPHDRMRGGGFGFSPFGGLFALPLMLLRGLLPLAVIGFAIYGVVAWFKRGKVASVAAPVMSAEKTCASCGQPAQAAWKHCPHCGNTL